jgi:hypothetical protein
MAPQTNLSCAGCGSSCGVLTAAQGTFSDGSGASNYANSATCQWIIAPTGATQVFVTFTEFSTESCCDILRVYQCATSMCEDAQLIAELSGTYTTAQSQTIMSNTGVLLLQFTTNSGTTALGFTAIWDSVVTGTVPQRSSLDVSLHAP